MGIRNWGHGISTQHTTTSLDDIDRSHGYGIWGMKWYNNEAEACIFDGEIA